MISRNAKSRAVILMREDSSISADLPQKFHPAAFGISSSLLCPQTLDQLRPKFSGAEQAEKRGWDLRGICVISLAQTCCLKPI